MHGNITHGKAKQKKKQQKEGIWKERKCIEVPPAAYGCMKPNNHLFFLRCEVVMLKIRPQVVSPP
jgi:hypothetical protein